MAARPSFEELVAAFMSPDNVIRRQAETVWEGMKMSTPDEVRAYELAVVVVHVTTCMVTPNRR